MNSSITTIKYNEDIRNKKRQRMCKVANQMKECVLSPPSTALSAIYHGFGIWKVQSTSSSNHWHTVKEIHSNNKKIFECNCSSDYCDKQTTKQCKHINGVILNIFITYLENQGNTEEKTEDLVSLFNKLTI